MGSQTRSHSFETLYLRFVSISLLVIIALLSISLWSLEATKLVWVTSLVAFIIPYLLFAWKVKEALATPLYSLSASLEAIRFEDYTLRTKPKFNSGAIKSISDEVSLIADDLKARKLNYDSQAILVFNLIEQLATPIAVFNANGCLHHGNDALSTWCGVPWRHGKGCSAQQLGLIFEPSSSDSHQHWRISDSHRALYWQLRYSEFRLSNERYQLVVLTNVEQVIKSTEKDAWQKMTRVLSHEINNSLSPIKSLAQSLHSLLKENSLNQSALDALDVIATRSDNLMRFVNRYATLTKQYSPERKPIDLDELMNKTMALFDGDFSYRNTRIQIISDEIMLEQVLINLIKNAQEACDKTLPIEIDVTLNRDFVEIEIRDRGVGLTNPDNLFVPFYTTKTDGKGIGLTLSRNIIEQLGGHLSLENRSDTRGTRALIKLPVDQK